MGRREFEEWMKETISLKQSTISSYGLSILNLSKWAISEKIISRSIYDINSVDDINRLDILLNQLDSYNKKNEDSHRSWQSALNYYKIFIDAKQNTTNTESEDSKFVLKDKEDEYTLSNFLLEVFITKENYITLISLLNRKKNLILQGAPGVGKTFVSKRLAYALMGKKDDTKIKIIQFHQNYSYEDFIVGYRPNGNGFELKKGPFYKFCKEASQNLEEKYIFIIDEINRGNMSKIFGELMMLIESDKRGEELEILYLEEKFHVPENVYIIGTMNTADRSLALIDYALRRRFCFFELEPAFDNINFKEHLKNQGLNEQLIAKINNKITKINSEIENDITLGKGFKIGHSYFCNYNKSDKWLDEIMEFEIKPLIKEYWFDEEERANSYIEELLR